MRLGWPFARRYWLVRSGWDGAGGDRGEPPARARQMYSNTSSMFPNRITVLSSTRTMRP